jgi:hypothetical protein
MLARVALAAVLSLTASSSNLAAQREPPPVSAPPPGARQPSATRPDSIQDSGLYGYWTNMTQQGRAGGTLLGRVTIEGEVLPWDPILVTVACKGNTAYTTQTDPKGEFLILPSKFPGELSQQGDRERQMEVHYEGCVVQAFLTGFRSTRITITVRHLRDDPSLGTLTLSRDSSARATAMSATIQTVTDEAAKFWSKAGADMLDGKPDRARQNLEKAVKAYPGFADAWYQLGRMQLLSSPRDAGICFGKALAADPKFTPPIEELAFLSIQQEDWQGAVEKTRHFLQLDPDGTMRVWYFNALANFQLGRIREAESSAKKLLSADPLHNIRNGEQLLAAILARKADYAGALAHLRNCLTYIPEGPDANLLKQQIAQLERRVRPAN